jgi:hypothetical protein
MLAVRLAASAITIAVVGLIGPRTSGRNLEEINPV